MIHLLFFFLFPIVFSQFQVVQQSTGSRVDVYVWKCPDEAIRELLLDAIKENNDPESINKMLSMRLIAQDLDHYWVTYTMKYSRIAADHLPTDAHPKSICLLQVPKENLVVVAVRISRKGLGSNA